MILARRARLRPSLTRCHDGGHSASDGFEATVDLAKSHAGGRPSGTRRPPPVSAWPDRRSGPALRGGSNEGGPYVADHDVPNEISVNNGLTPTAIHRSIQGGHLMRNCF